jgi:hypothetical protein
VSKDYAKAQVYAESYSRIQSLHISTIYLCDISESRISEINSIKRRLSIQWGLTPKEEEHFDAQITHENDQLSIYRSQLLHMQEQLKNGKERNQAACYLLSQKRLPVELWRRIFLFTFISHSGLNATIPISQVCRFWRIVSLDYPLLWSYVPIGSKFSMNRSAWTAELIYRTGSIARPESHPRLHIDITRATGPIYLDECFMSVQPHTPRITIHRAAGHYSSILPNARDTVIHQAMSNLHDLRHIHTLRISVLPGMAQGIRNSILLLELAPTERWPLRTIQFTELVPRIVSTPKPDSITKLSIRCSLWPEGNQLEELLADLAANLIELELEDLGAPSHSLHKLTLECAFPVLRVLRISLAGLTSNIDGMITRGCPKLSCLGIYELSATLDQPDYMIPILLSKLASESMRRLTTFEIHTCSSPKSPLIFYSLEMLHHMQAVRKLEMTGPDVPRLIHQLSQTMVGSRVMEVREVVFRNAELNGVDIVGAIGREMDKRSVKPLSGLRKLILNHCSGITRSQCDSLKEVVDELDIFC